MAPGPQRVRIFRTETPDSPPTGLMPGELSVEMADPLRLWVGVPATIDPAERRLLTAPLIVVGDTPPVAPWLNQLWWESDTGILWLWYNDGTSSQWVEVSRSGGDIEPVETDADQITFTPGGSLSADDVQEALIELDAEKVAKAGDTMTGLLVLSGPPTIALHATTKAYVDAADTALSAALALKIDDAPANGNTYGRKDNLWVVVATGGGGPVANAVDVAFSPTGGILANNVQTALAEVDAEKVAKAGDTMTGNLTISKFTPGLILNRTDPTAAYISGRVAGVERWQVQPGDATAEGGANTGSHFRILRYNDAGAFLDVPFHIDRTSGLISIKGDPVNALEIAPKQYVDTRVRYDAAQGLTAVQQAQARVNIAAAPGDVLGTGLQVNGSRNISQAHGANALSAPGQYPVDNVAVYFTGPAITHRYFDSPFPTLPHITGGIELNVTTADAVVDAGDLIFVQENIEGVRCNGLGWGTASARPISLGYVLRSNINLRGYLAVKNADGSRSYFRAFDLVANTDTYVQITVPGDLAGTWDHSGDAFGIGLRAQLWFNAGSTYHGAAGAWLAGNLSAAADITNLGAAIGNKVWVGPCIIVPFGDGVNTPILPSLAGLPAALPRFEQELATAKRYYQKSFAYGIVPGTINANGCERRGTLSFSTTQASAMGIGVRFPVTMRAAPSVTMYNTNTGVANSIPVFIPGLNTNGTPAVTGQATDGFIFTVTGVSPVLTANQPAEVSFHWTADARI